MNQYTFASKTQNMVLYGLMVLGTAIVHGAHLFCGR